MPTDSLHTAPNTADQIAAIDACRRLVANLFSDFDNHTECTLAHEIYVRPAGLEGSVYGLIYECSKEHRHVIVAN